MAAIKVNDSKKLEKMIKKTRRSFTKKMLTSNEIKGGNLPYDLKIKILKKLKNIDYEVFIIVFDKENMYKIGYNYNNKEVYDILASKLAELINIDKPTFIFIDKSKNKQDEIDKFNDSNFISSITHFLSIFILLKNIKKVHILEYELYSMTNGFVNEPSPEEK